MKPSTRVSGALLAVALAVIAYGCATDLVDSTTVPDGTDSLTNIKTLHFADRSQTIEN